MDVHCSTCREPWDVYHLRHEAIYETGLDAAEIQAWKQLPAKDRLCPRYREEFREVGFEFGASILDVRRCPCCPPTGEPDRTRVEMKAALTDILGSDEDGLAAMLEDLGL